MQAPFQSWLILCGAWGLLLGHAWGLVLCYRSPKTCPPIELSYVAGALLGLSAGLCFDWLAQRRNLKPAWRAAAVLLAIAVVAYILILPALQAARE